MYSDNVKSWLDDGLRPRAVTRDLDWGIPVPVEGADGQSIVCLVRCAYWIYFSYQRMGSDENRERLETIIGKMRILNWYIL